MISTADFDLTPAWEDLDQRWSDALGDGYCLDSPAYWYIETTPAILTAQGVELHFDFIPNCTFGEVSEAIYESKRRRFLLEVWLTPKLTKNSPRTPEQLLIVLAREGFISYAGVSDEPLLAALVRTGLMPSN